MVIPRASPNTLWFTQNDEEDAIRDYFRKGLTYDEILEFLDKYHGIEMSFVTLKRRIKEYGLKIRNGN